jgi:hypothetical protein
MLSLCAASVLYAATLEVSWHASTEPDIAGYRVYQTQTVGVWGDPAATVLAPATSVDLPNMLDGTYWIALTAYDTAGNESGKCEAVRVVVNQTPPAPPAGLKVLIKN